MRAGDVIAHRCAQPVVVVSRVVDGQQAAVLGVEQEQQPVEEHERGLADIGEVVITGTSASACARPGKARSKTTRERSWATCCS